MTAARAIQERGPRSHWILVAVMVALFVAAAVFRPWTDDDDGPSNIIEEPPTTDIGGADARLDSRCQQRPQDVGPVGLLEVEAEEAGQQAAGQSDGEQCWGTSLVGHGGPLTRPDDPRLVVAPK